MSVNLLPDGDLGLLKIPEQVNYPRIALMVVLQGLVDLTQSPNPFSKSSISKKEFQDAKEFFFVRTDGRLEFWCSVAGISISRTIRRAEAVLSGKLTRKDLNKGFTSKDQIDVEGILLGDQAGQGENGNQADSAEDEDSLD